MKVYDISQEVFACAVYPGDPVPQKETLSSMERGDLYNLTAFQMCAHNGTHIDAPFHFLQDGKTVEQIPLHMFVGNCYVAEHHGTMSEADATALLRHINTESSYALQRILIKGDTVITEAAALAFANAGIRLLGVESQSVGPLDAPMAVHKILLGADVVLLEGLRLQDIEPGTYLLNAAPLNLAGCDGAPCRAILISLP